MQETCMVATGSRADMLADKVKRYGIALKQVVTPMPSDASEILQFFF